MSHRARVERTREAIDLRAMIVEVVLAGHLRTRCLHQASERVTDGCPTRTAQVNRTRRVSGDILQVNVQSLHGLAAAESTTGVDDSAGEFARRSCSKTNINKTGAGDFGTVNALEFVETADKDLCKVTRVHPCFFGELHCDVARPVAVISVSRTLNLHCVGDVSGIERQMSLSDLGEQ